MCSRLEGSIICMYTHTHTDTYLLSSWNGLTFPFTVIHCNEQKKNAWKQTLGFTKKPKPKTKNAERKDINVKWCCCAYKKWSVQRWKNLKAKRHATTIRYVFYCSGGFTNKNTNYDWLVHIYTYTLSTALVRW